MNAPEKQIEPGLCNICTSTLVWKGKGYSPRLFVCQSCDVLVFDLREQPPEAGGLGNITKSASAQNTGIARQ